MNCRALAAVLRVAHTKIFSTLAPEKSRAAATLAKQPVQEPINTLII